MPLSRRQSLVAASSLGGAALAAACGTTAGPAAPTANLDTPARILWLNWDGTGVSADGNNKSVATFQAKYPKIKVENAGQPAAGDPYWSELSSLQAAGTPADLWEWEPKNIVDYMQNKLARDIAPFVARDKFDTSRHGTSTF